MKLNPFTGKLDYAGPSKGSGAGEVPSFPNAPIVTNHLYGGAGGGEIYPVDVGDGLKLQDNELSLDTKVLSLSSGIASWVNPSGKGVLLIPDSTHAIGLNLTRTKALHAHLSVRTNLHCLMSFSGDVNEDLIPFALDPYSDIELEISCGSSTDKIIIAILKSTPIPGDIAASGSPALHLNPSKWKGIAATTTRWIQKWKSVVGSNYSESTGIGSTRPTFTYNDPVNNGATVGFVAANSQVMPLHTAINSGTGYTILVAFKPSSAPAAFSMLTSGANHYFGVNAGGGITYYNGSNSIVTGNLGLGTTKTGWCVAAIRNGSAGRDIFVNLTKVKSTTGDSHPLQLSHIGSFTNGGYNYDGSLGEVLAYSSRLSDSEIATELLRMCKRWRTQSRFVSADGNSLTAGTNDGEEAGTWAWPTRLAALSPYDWVMNFGVSGQTTAQMESDAATEIDIYGTRIDSGKNVLFGWEIGNHLAGGASLATAQSSWATYMTNRQSAGFDNITIDIPKRNITSNLTDANVDSINAWMLADYQTWAKKIVRLSQIPEIDDKNDQTFRTTTTIHYNSPGYWRIALENYIKLALP